MGRIWERRKWTVKLRDWTKVSNARSYYILCLLLLYNPIAMVILFTFHTEREFNVLYIGHETTVQFRSYWNKMFKICNAALQQFQCVEIFCSWMLRCCVTQLAVSYSVYEPGNWTRCTSTSFHWKWSPQRIVTVSLLSSIHPILSRYLSHLHLLSHSDTMYGPITLLSHHSLNCWWTSPRSRLFWLNLWSFSPSLLVFLPFSDLPSSHLKDNQFSLGRGSESCSNNHVCCLSWLIWGGAGCSH